jgi:hypothetical protein
MADPLRIHESGTHGPSVVFACGGLPADDAIVAAGHEPNGYFWESVARYLVPEQLAALELDCEAGTFAAYGEREVLQQLRSALSPYIADRVRVTELIARAEAEGFEFDD